MINTIRRTTEWYPLRFLVVAVGPWVVLWLLVMGTRPVELGSALIALGMVTVPTAAVALGSSQQGATAWASGRGASFSAPWNGMLWQHLTRTRVARTLGVTLGLAAPMMMNGIYNAGGGSSVGWWPGASSAFGGYWLAASGYVVGSLWAEARKPRRPSSERSGAALLTPRRLGDYLDPNVGWALGVFVVIAVATVVAWRLAPLPSSSMPSPISAEWPTVVAPLLVGILAMCGAWWTAHRAERATDDAALAYEELTRTATVNALTGAAIAMSGEFVAQFASLPRDGAQISPWLLLPMSLVSLLGLGIWAGCGTKLVFRNRRIDALRAAA